ncbi:MULTISPECIES: hypothetical protein [unclassified Rhizobium]|uniref:hypothetical protein n=1 Tax=unclassified Rhizobium TaxID=2613769 RepID=UPI0016211DAA|nr:MULTISPECIES: hypothetical protein [unclassified Rhizobium]MBB3287014.1 hypothetical protein [Rhizobium sp. BK252]MBB3401754.1 hypothetical protein [Rhizobium sp. BK289]MBB3414302.1 hypothetical protein [Rhizobium sp. BK284]MBB3482189.1 hypothetical protein [Rhizobium sp. BK347]
MLLLDHGCGRDRAIGLSRLPSQYRQCPTVPDPTVGRRLSAGPGADRSVTPLPTLGKMLFAKRAGGRARGGCLGLCESFRLSAGGRGAGTNDVSGNCSTKAGFVSTGGACCR